MKLSKQQFAALVADAPRLTVPYNMLTLSSTYQVRPSSDAPHMELAELAASIKAVGLLQNLMVVACAKDRYEVCAGGRRWRAMGQLVAAGDWPSNYPVSVLVVPPEQALLISLAENRHHVPMHPADEFAGFARLIEQGRSVEEVAACFGVSPLVVTRRMKLGQVSPVLMALYREGGIDLALMMVLASVDDHQRQEQAWQALPEWNRRPDYLRALLTQEEVASTEALVRFVTLRAYEQAGGDVRHDLFSDDGTVYLQDRALLERLAHAQLALTAEQLLAEGWGWAETQLRFDYDTYRQHGRARPQRRDLTPEEAQRAADRLQAWEARATQREALEEDEGGDGDDAVYAQIDTEIERLEAEDAAQEQARLVWMDEVKASAGCVVSLDGDGGVVIRQGLLRPTAAVVPAAGADPVPDITGDGGDAALGSALPDPAEGHSKALTRCLTAHRVAAVQAELLHRPEVALAVLTAQLTQALFARQDYRYGSGLAPLALQVDDSHHALLAALEGSEHSVALQAVEAAYEDWQAQLPDDMGLATLVPWLLAQPQEHVLRLLAFVLARSVQGIYSDAPEEQATEVLAQALALDMRHWWQATAQTYFKHIPKQRIVAVVSEVVDARSACPLEGMKKEGCAQRAEQLLAGRGWLPPVLRGATPRVMASEAV